ncbi:beta-ketoacyl-[acyl-carrier-protein] synthase family protein [Kitasatospora sp. NPDC008050]|uniref:beta-ketoacyl-[acyl-carrier-protein] synthase family protein n=1 Tax=Kitasatospora sp. NPDC008050 TaxID=3364021 RepID=UPI0036EA3ED9
MSSGSGRAAAAVAVTGVGAVSAAGLGAETCWARVCAALPTARADPLLAGSGARVSCRVPAFDATALLGASVARRTGPFIQYALVAAGEALRQAGLDPVDWDGARVAVVTGSAFGGAPSWAEQARRLAAGGRVAPLAVPMFMTNMAAGYLSLALNARGPSLAVGTACASGASAIGLAAGLLRDGSCDLALAGGSEAAVDRLTAAAFARIDALATRATDPATTCRPFDRARDGFVLAEGAAMLVLERATDARARGARVLAELAGYAASADAHHPTSPDPAGRGLEAALRGALAAAGAGPGEVDHVNAHATGTPLGDLAEARTLHRLFGPDLPVTAAKGALGHTLGAAGALEAVLTVLSIDRGLVPPTANLTDPDPAVELQVVRGVPLRRRSGLALSTSAGFGGQNAVLAFAAP